MGLAKKEEIREGPLGDGAGHAAKHSRNLFPMRKFHAAEIGKRRDAGHLYFPLPPALASFAEGERLRAG
jgi:hypothetical protein